MGATRIGVIGCGRAALELHLPTLARIEEAEAVAIADADPAALSAAAERFGIQARSADYRELLGDERVEAVCIAGPSGLHAEMALAALDAGKHVLVEKPLALSLEDCDRLVERAQATGLRTMVGFNLRWHRHVRRARDLIQGGGLGTVRMLTSTFVSGSLVGDVPSWRTELAHGGGLLPLQAVHHFDLWAFLLGGGVEEISCTTSDPATGHGPEVASVAASLSDGARANGSFCATGGQEDAFAAYCSEAWLQASLYRFDSFETMPNDLTGGDIAYRARRPARFARELAEAVPSIRRGGDFNVSYQSEWRHFVDCVRSDRPPECGMEEGRDATRVLLAALESAAVGRPLRVENAPRTIEELSA